MSKLRSEIKQQKPFASLAEETLLNLVRTAGHVEAAQADLLAGYGLTPAQYNVLRILRGAGPDGHPCQEIGARMVSRVPDVTRIIDRLEAAQLVARSRGTADRRVVFVRIQKRALTLLGQLDKPMTDLPRRLFGPLEPRDLQTLNDLLVRARDPAD
ncbi:MAG: MarR family winged helix-turn-helix transcriptional regulator [Planctomycetota bacterium]